ncbi:MAG: NACHT domain-containing protein [Pyrinomonadaceae bacterium]|nr:NACHT domain-containing protein [Pyrinomonadaceae bacterium]
MIGFEWLAIWVKPILEILGFSFSKINEYVKWLQQTLGSHERVLAYRQHAEEVYSTTNLIGVSKTVPISNIFTEVNILNEPTANIRHNPSYVRKIQQRDIDKFLRSLERRNGLDVIKDAQNKRVLILGGPGSGKTTFLKYLAYNGSRGEFGEKLVTFISLKQWCDEDEIVDLSDYITTQFEKWIFKDAKLIIKNNLKYGNFIVLLDGVDEVFGEPERLSKIYKKINDFCETFLYSQVIVTCRTNELPYGFTQFTKVEIAGFENEQIKSFVKSWYECQEKKKPRFVQKFLRELKKEENDDIGRMASVPIILSLLCTIFFREETFPENKMQIFREAIDILTDETILNNMRDYIPSRPEIHSKINLNILRNLFNKIAYNYAVKNQLLFEKEDIKKFIQRCLEEIFQTDEYIDATQILSSIETQHGIIIERFKDLYAFSHRSFQEFFTANYFFEKGSFKELLTKERIFLGWRQTILNTASILDNNTYFNFFQTFQETINNLILNKNKINDLLRLTSSKIQMASNAEFKTRLLVFILLLLEDFYSTRSENTQKDLVHINTLFKQLSSPFDYTTLLQRNEEIIIATDLIKMRNTNLNSVRNRIQSLVKKIFNKQASYSLNNNENTKFFDESLLDKFSISLKLAYQSYEENNREFLKDISQLMLDDLKFLIKITEEFDIELTTDILFDVKLIALKIILDIYYIVFIKFRYQNEGTNIIANFVEKLVDSGIELGELELIKDLKDLIRIIFNFNEELYEKAVEKIDYSLTERRLKPCLELNLEDLNVICEYFQANELFLKCLEVAEVADSKSFENKMFMPLT